MNAVLIVGLTVAAALAVFAVWRALPAVRRWSLPWEVSTAAAVALVVLLVQRSDAAHHDRSGYQPGGNQDLLPFVVGAIVALLLLVWPAQPAVPATAATEGGVRRRRGPSIDAVRAGVVSAARAAGWVLIAFVFALACAAWATSGRAVVPFISCVGLLGVGALWRRGAPALAGIAAAGALAAAWGPGLHDTWRPADSALVIRPNIPAAFFPGASDTVSEQATTTPPEGWAPELRTGTGRVVVDLRALRLAAGSRLQLRARADRNRIVVAVPQDRCFRLVVHYERLGTGDGALPESVQELALAMGVDEYEDVSEIGPDDSPGGLPRPGEEDDTLVVFGRSAPGGRGTWTREVTDPNAPTVEMSLKAASQIVIRDFPDTGRFSFAEDGDVGNGPGSALSWPATKDFTFTSSAGEAIDTMFDDRSDAARDARIRAANVAWSTRQARRLAGACATRDERAKHVAAVEFYDPEGTHRDTTVVVDGNGDLRRERSTP